MPSPNQSSLNRYTPPSNFGIRSEWFDVDYERLRPITDKTCAPSVCSKTLDPDTWAVDGFRRASSFPEQLVEVAKRRLTSYGLDGAIRLGTAGGAEADNDPCCCKAKH